MVAGLGDGPSGIIDSHAHVASGFSPWRSGSVPADIVSTAAELGIGRSIVSSLGVDAMLENPTADELVLANEAAWAAVIAHPELAGMVLCSGEHSRMSLDLMNRYITDGPFVGIKLWIATRVSDPRVDAIAERAAELGVPVLAHAWHKRVQEFQNESTPTDVATAAARHPETTFIMAHLGGAGQRGVDEVAGLDNVVVDTSGGDPAPGLLEYAVSALGPGRVIFGSDVPVRDPLTALAKVHSAKLDAATRQRILRDNAARVFTRLHSTEG
ncbi:hypothetical protein N802_05535 [Knoellia sinensis KCTC 19936]|uniref:Amidohydrolase-related domain-containing protein n=2 Tax=Knoellia TaxID=136099 RepID=A0A0A0J403_9MICO|nr:hypothetical protein N802_05535 [Knoellia sinensis KCTC 19936]